MTGKRVRITGTVQGVGFRPFVYNLAQQFQIKGTVRNDANGVDICAAGPETVEFIEALHASPPPLAIVTSFTVEDAEVAGTPFTILESDGRGQKRADIGIDAAVCEDCLRELFDPQDRRYLYPFINCTHCGPRYTIIRGLPYDRASTSMAPFPLCPQCRVEYETPSDRRFHAQGNCCADCGPRYNDLPRAVRTLQEGGIVVIKGIGGYHLACNAADGHAVQRLRERKHRDEKPFALMVSGLAGLTVNDTEARLLQGVERPILLLDTDRPGPVAPGLCTLGVMLPYAPVHHLLFRLGGFERLVMTSGNRMSEPMAVTDGTRVLGNIADFVLEHDREIVTRNDDSVVRVMAGAPVFLRRARGFAPAPVPVDFDADGLVGCGAMLKNALAIGRGQQVVLSQHIGDLSNEETYESLARTAEHLFHTLGVTPRTAVCDLHPDYLSTRFAESLGLPVIRIQHHLAHACACLAENSVKDAIAVVYDGAGHGTDGHTWGGEIFALRKGQPSRERHLAYMPMPGGDACVEHPLRLAAAVLYSKGITLKDMDPVYSMLEANVNIHYTSGMGRLFDAAAALLGLCTHQTFEGQAPMLLESAANAGTFDGYDIPPFEPAALLEALYRDPSSAPVRAARFQNTLVQEAADAVLEIAARLNLGAVALTGGCFQNKRLLEGLIQKLQDRILVLRHRRVPANDGGIAFGQIVATQIKEMS
ncbi:MAG: carbamoyltransferase HypF [Fibrobacterota bacterium]